MLPTISKAPFSCCDIESAIEDTLTFTTIQRPDIVLRLSKKSEQDIVYTPQDSYQCYILDEEVDIGGYDVFRIVSRARTDKFYKEGAPIFHQCSEMKEYLYA